MLAIKIDNPDMEDRFRQYAAQQRKSVEDLINDALKMFLDTQKKDQKFIYTKKDPIQHLHQIAREYDDDFCDEIALEHIENSAEYVHNLRRTRSYE